MSAVLSLIFSQSVDEHVSAFWCETCLKRIRAVVLVASYIFWCCFFFDDIVQERSQTFSTRKRPFMSCCRLQVHHVYRIVDVPVCYDAKHNDPDSLKSWRLLRFIRDRVVDVLV